MLYITWPHLAAGTEWGWQMEFLFCVSCVQLKIQLPKRKGRMDIGRQPTHFFRTWFVLSPFLRTSISLNLLGNTRPHLICPLSTFYIVDSFFLRTHASLGFYVTVFLCLVCVAVIIFFMLFFNPPDCPPISKGKLRAHERDSTPGGSPPRAPSPAPLAALLLIPRPVYLALVQD